MGHTLEPLTALMLYVFSRHYYVVALIVATVSYSACCDLRTRLMPHYWKSGYFKSARVVI
jgi:hypothetical protein